MAPYSSLLTAAPQLPVLLVFTPAVQAQRTDVDQLVERIRPALTSVVQIMRVSESTHPEIVHSFGITSLPALVLLQRGQELWRYVGPVDNPDLFYQLDNQLDQTLPKI